jgi:hypothetical protein
MFLMDRSRTRARTYSHTDDGSNAFKGLVTTALDEQLKASQAV